MTELGSLIGSCGRSSSAVRAPYLLEWPRLPWSNHLVILPGLVIRGCIGIQYPMRAEPEQPSRLEVIPSNGRPPSNIDHSDLHMGNSMHPIINMAHTMPLP